MFDTLLLAIVCACIYRLLSLNLNLSILRAWISQKLRDVHGIGSSPLSFLRIYSRYKSFENCGSCFRALLSRIIRPSTMFSNRDSTMRERYILPGQIAIWQFPLNFLVCFASCTWLLQNCWRTVPPIQSKIFDWGTFDNRLTLSLATWTFWCSRSKICRCKASYVNIHYNSNICQPSIRIWSLIELHQRKDRQCTYLTAFSYQIILQNLLSWYVSLYFPKVFSSSFQRMESFQYILAILQGPH